MARGCIGFRGSCSAVVSARSELGSEIAVGWCPSKTMVPHISPHTLLTPRVLQVTFTLQAEGQHVVQTGRVIVWQLAERPQQAVVVVPQLCFLIQH